MEAGLEVFKEGLTVLNFFSEQYFLLVRFHLKTVGEVHSSLKNDLFAKDYLKKRFHARRICTSTLTVFPRLLLKKPQNCFL